jgi:Glycosyl transferase family 90
MKESSQLQRRSPRGSVFLVAIVGAMAGFAVFQNVATVKYLERAMTMPHQRQIYTAKENSEESSPATTARHQTALLKRTNLTRRSSRFPSVEERVKFYMANWYLPPCEGSSSGFVNYRIFNSSSRDDDSSVELSYPPTEGDNATALEVTWNIRADRLFHLGRDELNNCAGNRTHYRNMEYYCQDTIDTMLPLMQRLEWWKDAPPVPVLLQYGDSVHAGKYAKFPHFIKARKVRAQKDLQLLTSGECHTGSRQSLTDQFEGIIWKLEISRHYVSDLQHVDENDIPWSKKKNKAVFRGGLTGRRPRENDDVDRCMEMRRCRLVYSYHNSSLVDAKLISMLNNGIPEILNGVNLLGSKLSVKDQLDYKAVIMLEGNDVGTGVKWALLSNSVLIMQPPAVTSWAMEELLEPWVHYIPLNNNLTDVEEKMQWIIDNDEYAHRIAQRGTLWIKDLLFHRDAMADNVAVDLEILRRYRNHFRISVDL